MIYLIIGGYLMAIADSIPGVSGSTIAFILGFYDKMINHLDNIIHGKKKRQNSVIFFLKLGIGWIVGYISAIIVLTNLFSSHIYLVSSLFIGLLISAIIMIYFDERASFKKHQNFYFFIIGFLIVILSSYFSMQGLVINEQANLIKIGYYFFSGALAISAMLLPGISGSTVLLALGIYLPILNSIRELLSLNFSNLYLIISLVLGAIVALLLVTKKIKKALKNQRSKMMYLIMGFMTASIYAVTLGPLSVNQAVLDLTNINWFFLIIGMVLMGALYMGKRYHEKKIQSN